MNQKYEEADSISTESGKGQMKTEGRHTSKGEMIVMGVATGLMATTLLQTGKGIMTTLSRHPLIMLSLGIASGYMAHKYRKEIISITSKTAEQGKDFVLLQKENLIDLIAETQEDA